MSWAGSTDTWISNLRVVRLLPKSFVKDAHFLAPCAELWWVVQYFAFRMRTSGLFQSTWSLTQCGKTKLPDSQDLLLPLRLGKLSNKQRAGNIPESEMLISDCLVVIFRKLELQILYVYPWGVALWVLCCSQPLHFDFCSALLASLNYFHSICEL